MLNPGKEHRVVDSTPASLAGSQGTRIEQTFNGPRPHILVVDDEPATCQQLQRLYDSTGYTVDTVNSAEEALKRLEKRDIDLVLTDIKLPGMNGLQLIEQLQRVYPDVSVIVSTAYPAIDHALEALRCGACDYIVKPFTVNAIQQSTRATLEKRRVFSEIRNLRGSLHTGDEFGPLLSKMPEMRRVFETIRMVSPTNMTVVLDGENGTGKELVASAIHCQSSRRDGPFITVNCAGFPDSLLERELFGCEQEGLTEAEPTGAGKIELARGGTLFIDEIDTMALFVQSRLLRVIEEHNTVRLGGNRQIHIDVRVIAATNVPLADLVAQGKMRTDFYYRINVIPIHLLPLRERLEDIPLLVDDFLRQNRTAIQKGITGISQHTMNTLIQYRWPGNISQLHNVLEKAIVLTKGTVIESVDLPVG
jgi:DNA-binding NtrC family response regulator